MQTAEITVQYVNQPKPGKKWGAIKDTNGVSYWGPPAALSAYQPGGTYTIQFNTNEEGFNQIGGAAAKMTASPRMPSRAPQEAAGGSKERDMAAMGLINRRWHASWEIPLDTKVLEQEYRTVLTAWDNAHKADYKAILDDEIPGF